MTVIPPLLPSPPAAAKPLPRHDSRRVWPWFYAFMLLSMLTWFWQQVDFAGSLTKGIPIPDVVNMASSIENLFAGGAISQEENQFIGVSIIYGWTWLIHPSLCFVVNTALMAWATRVYSSYFVRELHAPAWSVVGLVGNPYLILAMIGPNKEIPLLLLTVLYARCIIRRRSAWPLMAALISAAAYLFRDGHGAFLLGSTIALLVFRLRAKPYALLVCLGCAALATLYGTLESFVPILSRNVQSFEAIAADNLAVGALAAGLGLDPFSPVGGFITFVLRLIYNLFSLAFFPVFKTSGGIYWIGIAYWINGILLLVGVLASVTNLLKREIRPGVMMCAALGVATWFVVSVSLYVQPRYLSPALPLAMAAYSCSSKKLQARTLQFVIALIAFIIIGYGLLDRAPPLADPDTFNTPAYIL